MKNLNHQKISLPRFVFGNVDICTYCGDVATGVDHIISVNYQSTSSERRHDKSHFGPTTFSCRRCNSRLNDFFFDDFESRCECVQHWLAKKMEPVLWSKWQMKELDISLRSYVEADVNRRLWIQGRIDWYGSIEFYKNIDNLGDEFTLKQGHELFCKPLHGYFASMLERLREKEQGCFGRLGME